jgi:anti-sigma28 factor (negative regulator of flagellin synthesis)
MATGTRTRRATNGTRHTSSVQQEARAANSGLPMTDAPSAQLMTVTPELAEAWLGRNSHNRPIRQRRVEDIQGAIERGEWKLNGDAIRFGVDGTLLDGQHRLWAVWLAGQPVETLVVTGLDGHAQETMDTGARRNLKDALSLRGVSDASKIAAVVNYKWRYDNDKVRMPSAIPTIAQGIQLYEAHPGLAEWTRQAGRILLRFRMSVGMLATALYSFAEIDEELAYAFVEKLISGAGLDEGDPILVLRRHLERQSMGTAGARASAVVTHALLIKAWNAWREGRQVAGLNWKAAGLNAEAFPEPR